MGFLMNKMGKNVKKTKITIRARIYSGDVGVGTPYVDETEFIVQELSNNTKEEDGIVSIVRNIDFCADESMYGYLPSPIAKANKNLNHGKIRMEIPFLVSYYELETINEIINTIKTNPNYKKGDPAHYSNGGFDKKQFEYDDIIIDGQEYEIHVRDELYSKIYSEVLGGESGEIPKKVDDFKDEIFILLRERNYGDIVKINRPFIERTISKLKDMINGLQADTETTIAQLLQISNGTFPMSEPLVQKAILNGLIKECEKSNIKIEVSNDEIEELPFLKKLKKIN